MSYTSKHTGAEIDAGIDAANAALSKSGDTMTGPLTLFRNPELEYEAATKKYVDEAITGLELTPGKDGESAYEIALGCGFEGSESEWIDSLNGADGDKGDPGADGTDGVSPVVTVDSISGGHRVNITDVYGTMSFEVMDGVDGAVGDGSGDMLKTTYDTNDNGIVDNAEMLGGKTPDHYASSDHTHDETDPTVPSWAKESDAEYELSGDMISLRNYEHMPMNVSTVFEPQQEGSNEPYPPGGGRNKLFYSNLSPQTSGGVTFTPQTDGSVVLSGTAAKETFYALISKKQFPAGNYILSGGISNSFAIRAGLGEENTSIGHSYAGSLSITLDETSLLSFALRIASGAVCDGVTMYPMLRLASDTDESFAPISNIRPFVGYNNLKLMHVGKNLFELSEPGSVDVNGNDDANTSARRTPYIPCIPGEKFTFSKSKALTNTRDNGMARLFDGNKNYLRSVSVLPYNALQNVWTVPSNVSYFRFVQFGYTTQDGLNVQIERGGEVTPYDATANTYEAQPGQTVYGGEMDWNTGRLTVDWVVRTLNGTEDCVLYEDGTTGKGVTILSVLDQGALFGTGMCSHAQVVDSPSQTGIVFNDDQSICWAGILDTLSMDTSEEFGAWLSAQNAAGTPVQIACKSAQPTVIQLDKNQIAAVRGENTLYGGGETLYASGRKDPYWLIDSLVERIVALEGQSQN